MSESITTPNSQSAIKSGRNAKMHATNDAQTVTVCGLSTVGMFKGGFHAGECAVTCGNCKRILAKRPRITITIDIHEYSGYAEDHDDCEHTDNACDDCGECITAQSEGGERCDNCSAGTCECESVADQECEDNGGLWLDGDHRTIDETSDTFEYEADTMDTIMADREILTVQDAYDVYVDSLIGSPLSQYKYLDWDYEGNGHECDGDSCFDYSVDVYGPGVTDTVKAMILRSFAHR